MSVSVCLSASISMQNYASDLLHVLVHVSYVGGSVLDGLALSCRLFLFFLRQRTNSLPALPSSPSSPLPLKVGPLSPARSLGKRCKIAHYGLGRSRSRQTIWCILDSKTAALHKCPRQFLLIFLRTNVIFCTKTSLISYGRYNSSHREGRGKWRQGDGPAPPPKYFGFLNSNILNL